MEYLQGDQESFLGKCSHVEYKRLKKVLKNCRSCKTIQDSCSLEQEDAGSLEQEDSGSLEQECQEDNSLSQLCQDESCKVCDQMFFSELKKEASEIAGCFSSKVRQLLHLHIASGMQRYMMRLRQCFKNNEHEMVQEGRMLIEYVTMNAIAIRKILKKYDKIHGSVNGKNFKSKMRAEHIELLQSPWLIELGAFYLNFNGSDGGESDVFFSHFFCNFNPTESVMTLMLPDSVKLEYNLTCAICLDTVFNPYALSCGHLFCKSCACSSASVMIFEGPKAASPESKCPICREVGVYANSVHMVELDMLLKNRCKEYWKERLNAERAEMVKQSKDYWDLQTKYVIGY